MSRAASAQKYSALRQLSYRETILNAGIPGLRLTRIDEDALVAYENWPDIGRLPPEGGWNWRSHIAGYRNKPARFELAIWLKDKLCGLAVGAPSKSKILLKVELIEGGAQSPNPLKGKIIPVTFFCAESYASGINANEVHVMEPANQDLINYYQRFGYTYIKGTKKNPHHLTKTL